MKQDQMGQAVFLDRATLDRGDLDLSPLEPLCSDWVHHDLTPPESTLERVRDAEVVVTNKVVLDRAILESCSRLRLVCIAATGTNNVDLDAARELGIPVTHVAGYSTPSVVQYVFAVMLSLFGRLEEYRAAVRAGDWQRSASFCLLDFPIAELQGKRLGILGYGDIGQAVGRVAEAFGMQVRVANRPGAPAQPGRLDLRDLLPQVDVLTLHCALSEQTRGIIGPAALALMPRHALLINTARGGIVDEVALAEALRRGEIGGAAVDVLSHEPPVAGNPLLEPGIPNLVLTPHIAWASRESRQRLVEEIARNIAAFLAGTVRNRVA